MNDRLLLWAQSQIVGQCLVKNNPELLEKLPSIDGDEVDENSHEMEFLGGQFVFAPYDYQAGELKPIWQAFEKDIELDTETLREIIVELLMARTCNSSFWREKLQVALRALNAGEVNEFVSPPKKKKQGMPYSLDQWKLEAVKEVYFRVGKGMRKGRAQEEVGKGIGASTETGFDPLRSSESAIQEAIFEHYRHRRRPGAVMFHEHGYEKHGFEAQVKVRPHLVEGGADAGVGRMAPVERGQRLAVQIRSHNDVLFRHRIVDGNRAKE